MSKITSSEVRTAISGALAEWLFAIVPLMVLTIVMTHLGRSSVVLESAEWAFGASVLAGQALVRFVAGAVSAKTLLLNRVLLGVSVVFVFVVVPANVILALVIVDEAHKQSISSLLATMQAGLFFIASVLFIIVSSFAHLWARPSESRHQN